MNRYNIPETINIGGHEFNIAIGTRDDYLKSIGVVGEMDFERSTILIASTLTESVTKQVLAHEILHALLALVRSDIIDGETEEALIKIVDNCFYRFLADNTLDFFKSVPKINKDMLVIRQDYLK